MSNQITQFLDQDDKFDQLIEQTQQNLLDGIATKLKGFQVTFTGTKTNKKRLVSAFLNQFEEIAKQVNKPPDVNLLMLYVASQQFLNRLEETKLYKNVNMMLLPGVEQDIAYLHFQMIDRSPFFFSLQNEFERDGSAILSFKSGYKNFLRREDILQFEFEKGLNRSGWNWMLNWNYKDLKHNSYQIDLKQSYHNIQTLVEESRKEVSFKYETPKGLSLIFSNQTRANKINQGKELSLMDQYLYNQHLNNLDFMPSSSVNVNLMKPLYNNIVEAETSNVQKGSSCSINSTVGLPFLSQHPFLKFHLSHQFHLPTYQFKNTFYGYPTLKQIIKNSSLQVNLNYGMSISNHLMINDTFQNIQFRGFGQVVNGNQLKFQPQRRQMDSFAKLDLKFNVYNHEHLKKQNISMFYYLSFFTLHTHFKNDQIIQSLLNNLRMSCGLGLAIPLSNSIHLEALLGLMHFRTQKFDKPNIIQLRLSMDD